MCRLCINGSRISAPILPKEWQSLMETEASRSLVRKAAIVVVKIPRGVEWINGNKVYLAFGIAGSEEEHVDLLGELATILMDADQKEKLMAAESEDDLFTRLTK
ncbi:MAG TPA: hypothetical protein DCP36_00530 [Sporomusaceae bacterium]|nr:hypothetical protein [Sporomusaceae bacterium]